MTDSGCEDTVPPAPAMPSLCKLPEESDATMRARLFNSLSQSFPHSQLYKALHGEADLILGGDNGPESDDDDDSLYGDHLSNSCFASLRMDRRDSDDFDDDLRSLEWLQSEDLLKNIGGEILDQDDVDGGPVGGGDLKENDMKPDLALLQASSSHQPPHLPYMPQKHVNSKPPYSFSCLIFMAVEASPQKRLPVKDIYNWILTQFPYFQNAPTGWKNSVRHNLSLNKCFKKVEKDKGQSIGKGSLWCIDPAYRPNLLQALRKTPYHPYHQLQMTSTQHQNYMLYQSLPGSGRTVLPLTPRPVPNTVSPHLFPFLSRRLAQTSFDIDNEMKDVAQTLVALKSSIKKEKPDLSALEDIGPTWRNHKRLPSYAAIKERSSSPVIVTDHPHIDHAYSSSRILEDDSPSHSSSSSSSIDEEYDFGDADEECESDYQSDMEWDSDAKDEVDGDVPTTAASSSNNNRRGKLKIDIPEEKKKGSKSDEMDEDEQKKLCEGASALLNLAGFLLDQSREQARAGALASTIYGDSSSATHCAPRDVSSLPLKKRPTSRGRPLKRSRDEEEESEDDDEEEEEEEETVSLLKTPSKSKRKNAGSNAKYNKKEYSLGKVAKGSSKKRSNPLSSENGKKKTQAVKPVGAKHGKKPGKPASKPKAAINNVNSSHKAVKKKSSQPKKLKLSTKAFGKKDNSNGQADASPVGPRKAAVNNPFVKNGFSKRSSVSPSPKIKAPKLAKPSESEVAATQKAKNTPQVSPDSTNKNATTELPESVNNDKSSSYRASPQLSPSNNNNNNNNNSSSDLNKNAISPSDKPALPTASGDAPAIVQSEPESPIRYTPPPAATTLTSIIPSHKSPHFTRFSKKKKF